MTPVDLAKSGSEHGEQMALFAWANWKQRQTNEPRASVLDMMFAIPNGGLRHAAEANKLKAEGVKKGPADVCLPVSIKDTYGSIASEGRILHCGLYIEIKKRDGVPSDQSPEQKKFEAFVREQGYVYKLCFGWQQARDAIARYLSLTMTGEWDTL